MTSAQELVDLYEESVIESTILHSEAYTAVIQEADSARGDIPCPLIARLYDACSGSDSLSEVFSYDEQFAGNISFDYLGVILQADEGDTVSLDPLTSDQVCKINRPS